MCVSVRELHAAIAELTGRKISPTKTTSKRVEGIGLVLASRFGPRPNYLGVMFETGWPLADDRGAIFDTSAEDARFLRREGCAVFVDAIRGKREPEGGDAAVSAEVFFTAVHELGHVFNLWHLEETPYTFMTTSADKALLPTSEPVRSSCRKGWPSSAMSASSFSRGASRSSNQGCTGSMRR